MALETTQFDPAEYLGTPEAQAEYLASAFESGSADDITRAVGVVARARGMSAIAADTGLGRESLYKSLREGGDPKISTMIRVMASLGVKLSVKPANAA